MKLQVDSRNEPILYTENLVGELYQAKGALRGGRVIEASECLDRILNLFAWGPQWMSGHFPNQSHYEACAYQVVRQLDEKPKE